MRTRIHEDAICKKCGKEVKMGKLLSEDGLCYRCDENRILRSMHIQEAVDKKQAAWLREKVKSYE